MNIHTKPKKSLGQNFLTDKRVAEQMVVDAMVNENDTVLEIGPGKGILTREIIKKTDKIIAVEKDEVLAEEIRSEFKKNYPLNDLPKIVTGDILNIEPQDINLKDGEYKLVANIPYYITGEIIRKFLTSDQKPALIILLVQKEVAKRIINEKESLLSLSIKAYGNPRYIKTVKRGSFYPAPNVDSAIILIENIKKPEWSIEVPENLFFETIKAGFAHKRKFAKSNLSEIFGKEKIENIWNYLKLDQKERAENIHLDTWVKIAGQIISS